jgi:hypothetical protein
MPAAAEMLLARWADANRSAGCRRSNAIPHRRPSSDELMFDPGSSVEDGEDRDEHSLRRG